MMSQLIRVRGISFHPVFCDTCESLPDVLAEGIFLEAVVLGLAVRKDDIRHRKAKGKRRCRIPRRITPIPIPIPTLTTAVLHGNPRPFDVVVPANHDS